MLRQVQESPIYFPLTSELKEISIGVLKFGGGLVFLGTGALISCLDTFHNATTTLPCVSSSARDYFTGIGIELISQGYKPTLFVAGVGIAIIKFTTPSHNGAE